MQDPLTLAELERRTGVTVDRLRYILDARILPGSHRRQVLWQKAPGRGVARTFTPFEAFGILVAILMLDAGVKRHALKGCLELLCRPAPGSGDFQSAMLWRAFGSENIAGLELGDGLNVRLVHNSVVPSKEREPGSSLPAAEPWWQLQTAQALAVGYEPLVTIRINVAGLRARLGKPVSPSDGENA